MADIEITSGDTRPPIEATFRDPDGSAANLVGGDVRFLVEDTHTGEVIIDSSATLVTASEGEVRYSWNEGDTDEAGYYEAKFKVVYGASTSDPDVQHFPNDERISI